MRILLTNNTLAVRAGTELYVRDLAIELMRRGHQPVAYSTKLGQVAEELRAATVPVISSVESLGEEPDIIHGHHHYETLTAMLWFPQTPAISYCHGWTPWEETPLRFPRILRYVAIDELCRERLITEGGIAPERIELIPNFFDPDLFRPRPPLPAAPRRALAFSNDFREDNGLAALREVCREAGIELDAVGFEAGNSESQPGRLLANYDVVFAKGRAAIEAMAVGAAVILCQPGRLGPMVTSQNFATLRRFNFGIRTLSLPLSAGLLGAELRRYDAEDAMGVARLARGQCPLAPAADRIIGLYERVIAEARTRPARVSPEADRAAALYLERYALRYKFSWQAAERWRTRRLAAEQDSARWKQRCEQAERDAAAVRSSATWRWTQTIAQNRAVNRIFGRWIRSVAERSARGES